MTVARCDIDIDFYNRDDLLSRIPHVVASRIEKGKLKKHLSGIYLQPIPANPLTNIANIEQHQAESLGYFKLDVLNVSAYKGIRNESHINELLTIEPIWELLQEESVCSLLTHINGYHELLAKLKPQNIEQLAMTIAMIRPGKKHLQAKCEAEGFDAIKSEIWTKVDDSLYSFKFSHSLGYATLIIMQLNLICSTITT